MAGIIRGSSDSRIKRIEFHFFREKEIREAVYYARNGRGGKTGGSPTGHSYVSDPTAINALRRAVELNTITLEDGVKIYEPEKWMRVFDAVRAWCEGDVLKAEILRRRYAGENRLKTCYELHISITTRYTLMSEINNFALLCAVQMGLIKVM